jgi:hypothetical protein
VGVLSNRSASVVEITQLVRCGEKRHEVTIVVTAWGALGVVFNPCDCLPAAARAMSNSGCGARIQSMATTVSQRMQDTWLEWDARSESALSESARAGGRQLDRDIREFVGHVEGHRAEMAKSILADAQGKVTARAVAEALESGEDERQWAAMVFIAEKGSNALRKRAGGLLAQSLDWPASRRIALLACTRGTVHVDRSAVVARSVADETVSIRQRMRLIQELGELGDLQYAATLLAVLRQRERIATFSPVIVEALRSILMKSAGSSERSPVFVDLLADLLRRAETLNPLAAMLAECADLLFDHLQQIARSPASHDVLRHMAVQTLAAAAVHRAAPTLTELLLGARGHFESWKSISAAIRLLASRLPPHDAYAREWVAGLIESDDDQVVLVGLSVAGRVKAGWALDVMMRRIPQLQSREIRASGVETIGRVGDHRVVGPLMDVLDQEEDEEMREIIGDALVSILQRVAAGEVYVDVLRRTLDSGIREVCAASVCLLVRHRSAQAIQTLVQSLRGDLASDCKLEVLAALQECGDRVAAMAVIGFLEDGPSALVRRAATAGISRRRALDRLSPTR